MVKTVYQTDTAGHFIGMTQADESPMESGVFLIPSGAVEVSLPASWTEDKWPRFNGSAWELITRPTAPVVPTPTEKLSAFLQANPDVAALIK